MGLTLKRTKKLYRWMVLVMLFIVLCLQVKKSYWHWVYYASAISSLDSRITILETAPEEKVSYQASFNQTALKGKPSLVLINNGWNRRFFLDHSMPSFFESCLANEMNLVYLSNGSGSTGYNRKKGDWLKNVCDQRMYGFHLYASDSHSEQVKYAIDVDEVSQYFPVAFLLNDSADIVDTFHRFTDEKLVLLLSPIGTESQPEKE